MRRPGTPRPEPGADPAYAGLKARIVARTGHHYYADKDDLLIERLRRRFRAAGTADCAAYAALLADGARGEAEWERLEAEITVGETFFFRYAEQFQALRATILPDRIAAREPERTLRIWSAGCSTGAEPYSLAILVRETLGDRLPDWRVQIRGSDISIEALATARAAEYGRWALRTMPPEDRIRYFTRLPAAPGVRREGGYALRPEFRAMVRFERDNLLKLAEPGLPPGEGFDLILCRNVLIYFDAETVAAVVRGLGRRLRRGGWLLLGHAEPNPAFSGFLDPVSLPGTVAYRRREEPALPAAAGAPDASRGVKAAIGAGLPVPKGSPLHSSPDEARVPSPVRERDGVRGAPSPERPVPSPQHSPERERGQVAPHTSRPANDEHDDSGNALHDVIDAVRALADAGETGAAWRTLRTALDREPTDPALRFYEGLIARTLGRDVEAERALRAALYLDRGFVMAHYHLGLLLVALGRPAEGARAFDNAATLCRALPPDAVLPEGDGAVAGEVAAGVAMARSALGVPAGAAFENGDRQGMRLT